MAVCPKCLNMLPADAKDCPVCWEDDHPDQGDLFGVPEDRIGIVEITTGVHQRPGERPSPRRGWKGQKSELQGALLLAGGAFFAALILSQFLPEWVAIAGWFITLMFGFGLLYRSFMTNLLWGMLLVIPAGAFFIALFGAAMSRYFELEAPDGSSYRWIYMVAWVAAILFAVLNWREVRRLIVGWVTGGLIVAIAASQGATIDWPSLFSG